MSSDHEHYMACEAQECAQCEGELTLTDFLLARIAEDEEAFYAEVETNALLNVVIGEDRRWFNFPAPLRDIESKRKIVELHTGAHECRDVLEHPDGYVTADQDCTTKRLLALPYADHPDYREEWRP